MTTFRLVNPIRGGLLRTYDKYGSGAFGSSRDKGKRKHNGVDIIASPGDTVFSPVSGVVTKRGYPYADDLSFRYVEITTNNGLAVRVFYVWPAVKLEKRVVAGKTKIGLVQDLEKRYPGITNHVHLEIKNQALNTFTDPTPFLLGEI